MPTTRIKDLSLGASISQADSFPVDKASPDETQRTNIEQILTALGIPATTVAALPSTGAATGRMRFCTDGRKAGEGAGLGTGQIAIRISGSWLSVDDGATVVA